jgi:hypothetical protein
MAQKLGTTTINGVLAISCDVDPSAGIGLVAPIGSFASAVDGSGFYYKSTASNTGWSNVSQIKGSIGSVNGEIPFGNGTANTLQSSANFTYVSNILTLGTPIIAGGTYVTDSDSILIIARTTDATVNSNAHGYVDATIFKKNTNGFANNAYTDNGQTVGTANYDHHASFQSQFIYNSSGTMTSLYGTVDIPTISSGTVTNRYGFYAFNPTGAGAITNNYGIYIPTQTKGTNNYAIYVAGGKSLFKGEVLFGSVAGQQMNIQGDFAGSGELPVGSFISSNNTGNVSITPNNSGGAGSVVLSYFSGSAFFSALEFANASGYSTLKLMKSGGNVSIGLGATTASAILHLAAGTTSNAQLRLTSGTAPTSPNDGDIWFDGADLKMRIAGVTKTFTLI